MLICGDFRRYAALWGPLHGGANQAVIEMLSDIQKDGGNYRRAIERAKIKKILPASWVLGIEFTRHMIRGPES